MTNEFVVIKVHT